MLFNESFPLMFSFMSGDIKKMLAPKCGLEPKDQRLFFRGKEKEDDEDIHTAGLKGNSKVLLLEDQASKERKLEQLKKAEEMAKACEAVGGVRVEVDKLSERVSCEHLHFIINFFFFFEF